MTSTLQTRFDAIRRSTAAMALRVLPHARLGAGVAASAGALALVGGATSSTLLLAPFAASAALKHGAPSAVSARPRNVMGAYLLAALVGASIGWAVGDGWLAIAAATSITAVALVAFNLEHPPAVAMAFIALHTPGLWPIEVAAAGSFTLVLTMALLSPSLHGRRAFPVGLG